MKSRCLQCKKLLQYLLYTLAAISSLWGIESFAQESNSTSQSLANTVEQKLESTQKSMSKRILNMSLRIDNTLGYDTVDEELPDSKVTLKIISASDSVTGQEFKARVSTQLSLPRTQKRWHLFLNNMKKRSSDDDIKKLEDYLPTDKKDADDEDFTAGIRRNLFQSKKLHLHTESGVRLHSNVDPFIKVKSRQSLLNQSYSTHFTQEASYFDQTGYGYHFGLRFDRPLNPGLIIRQVNTVEYSNEDKLHWFENSLSLINLHNDIQSTVYFVNVTSKSEPFPVSDSYNLGLTYRTQVKWKWMNLSITPLLNYARERDFELNSGFTVQLETEFGAI